MTFLAPWAGWFLAGIPVIVLLYLLKLKRRPVSVSTLMFWQKIMEENQRRALFQKLRNLFSLLLHLIIFALILGALAKPVFDRSVRDGSSTVIILDTRARMQALESGSETRLDLAKKLAANYLGQTAAQRQFAILTAHVSPVVAAPFTNDEKLLRETLKSVPATQATGDLSAAVQLAEELLAAREGVKRIVVFTAPGEKLAGVKAQSPLEVIPVGSVHDNVAITRFATRALLNSPQTSEVLMEIANFGTAPAQGNLELSFDGKLLDVKPVTLAPGERQVKVFPTIPRAGANARGWLSARLVSNDALQADNVAYAVLPPQKPRRVLLITKGNWFLEKLLEADQGVKFELLVPESFEPGLASKFDAIVFDNFLPAGFDWQKATGNYLFIRQTPFAAPEAKTLEQPLISETSALHPALRLVNLQNVTVVKAAALAEPPKGTDWRFETPIRSIDPASSLEHPLMITAERRGEKGPQRLAALAMDLTESDLPLRVAFPLLMSNTVQWLAGEPPAPLLSLTAGQPLSLPEGDSIWGERQTEWKRDLKPNPEQQLHGVFQPLSNGYYLRQQPEGSHWLAVNTFSDAESDLRAGGEAPAPNTPSAPILALASFSGWPLWHYLALAALLLFTLEWWLFHRRRTE